MLELLELPAIPAAAMEYRADSAELPRMAAHADVPPAVEQGAALGATAKGSKNRSARKKKLLAREPCSGILHCDCGEACNSEEWGPSLAWRNDFKEQLKEHLASCFPEKAGLVFTSFHRVATELERSMGLPRRALRPSGPAACLHLAAAELLGKGQG